MATDRRYLFAPLEQRGLIAGLRTGQVVILAVGLLTAVGLVRAQSSPAFLVVALIVIGLALAVAFVQFGGRPVEQWAPVAGRYVGRRVVGHSGTRATAGTVPVPRSLGGLGLCEQVQRPGLPPMGVVVDRPAGTFAAVLAARGRSFALLDTADKERRLTAWGGVLAALAREGGPVRSLQWVERTVGGDAETLAHHLSACGVRDADSSPVRSYRELINEAGPVTQEHECYVVLTVKRRAGPGALAREVRLLEGQLRNAEVDVRGVLGVRELGAALRSAYDPDVRARLSGRAKAHPDLAGSATAAVWPSATESTWATYRTDTRWHATFWIAEWPRTDVGPDFLGPLLLHGSTPRTVALVMAPISPSDGFREAEAARTAAAADEELRRRAGFLGTARRRREAEGLARREAELSDGHASYRFSGYITVSAPDPEHLDEACGEIIQVAHQCRLDLRRLYGLQDLAFTWTLPLGRGLA